MIVVAGQGGARIEEKAASAVVVIEDEAIVLAGYQMLFESWGHRVVAAQSIGEAMEMLAEEGVTPRFILADFRLRDGQTGIDAIEYLRRTFDRNIPGVVVTGDTTVTVESLRAAKEAGMQVLHKPVNGRQLQDVLARAEGGSFP
jgi:two-component system phosphate regulon response regulator PhoB